MQVGAQDRSEELDSFVVGEDLVGCPAEIHQRREELTVSFGQRDLELSNARRRARCRDKDVSRSAAATGDKLVRKLEGEDGAKAVAKESVFERNRRTRHLRHHVVQHLTEAVAQGRSDPSAVPGELDRHEIEVVDTQKTLTAQVTPQDDGGVEFELQSKSFEVPFGAQFVLADFGMKGHFAQGELVVKEFDARLFDGVLKGFGRLTATDGWTFEGQVEARTFELNRIAPAIFTTGRVQGKGTFTMSSDNPTTLFANPTLKGRFTSTTGQFTLADLGRSIQSGTPQGGSTVYQDMQGELEIAAGRVLVKNAVFSANSLAGAATADIDQKGALFGRVGGELRTPAGQARSAFLLTGTLDKPALKGGGAR